MMKKNSLIYVVGHEGFIGLAIVRKLKKRGYKNLLLKKLDLFCQEEVERLFKNKKPEYVFFPSVKAGGILANITYPADFIYQNLASQINIIHSAFKYGVKKLLFLGSACSYPKICPQPIKEKYLLTGSLETTNEPYAISKISGIKMCQAYNKQYKTNFISAIPTNTFGPDDDFGKDSHVVDSLIKKFYEAKLLKNKIVKVWGTGKPKREFVYIDDIADACLFLMQNYDKTELINIAGGEEFSIKELAELIKKISGFEGKIIYETQKPDGMLRRILDTTKISALGWQPKIKLEQGLKLTYQWYKNHYVKR